jgi:hypothetical protein
MFKSGATQEIPHVNRLDAERTMVEIINAMTAGLAFTDRGQRHQRAGRQRRGRGRDPARARDRRAGRAAEARADAASASQAGRRHAIANQLDGPLQVVASAIVGCGCEAENICSIRAFPVVTHLDRRVCIAAAAMAATRLSAVRPHEP